VTLLDFADDIRVIEELFLVGGRRGQEMEEVVPLPGRGLRRRARGDFGGGDVVHDHVGAVSLAPLLREDAIEPPVVAGDVVAPLDDPQRLAPRRPPRAGTRQRARRDRQARRPHELPPRDAARPPFPHAHSQDFNIPSHTVKSRRRVPAQGDTRGRASYNRPVALLDPGVPFPALPLRDEKGDIAAVPSGERLYGFFKTTCPTCEFAWPYLDRIRKLAEGGGLSVLAVSQDDPETTARFYGDLGVAIPTLYDPEPWQASERLGLEYVPTFFLVGPGGVLGDSVVGFQRSKMKELAHRAARLAGRPAPALFRPGESVPAIKPG